MEGGGVQAKKKALWEGYGYFVKQQNHSTVCPFHVDYTEQ